MKRTLLFAVLILSLSLVPDVHAAKPLKKTIAVFDFQNDSGYSSIANIGQDLSIQLSDALVQSGKFVVLSRKDLDVVFAEQDLAASDRMAKSNTAQKGKAIPAQILIKGQITEFQENTSGGGQGISIQGFSIGGKKSSAHVAVIIQLIDSTTGEIIDSQRVEGEANSGGLSVGYSGSFGINSSSFQKTPLGKAVQMAIDRAVKYVSDRMADIPWQGKVVTVNDGLVFVNAGSNADMTLGKTLSVWKEGEALIDPDTGMNLGSDAEKVASIEITNVQEKFSKAKVTSGDLASISKGDLVKE